MSVQDLVPSVSLDNLVQKRDAMVERLQDVFERFREVNQLAHTTFGHDSYHNLEIYLERTRDVCTVESATKLIDCRAWSFLLNESGLRTFMDAEARATWDKAIEKNDVPVLTVANIEATFSAMHQARGEMFERGVLAVFKSLSWDYKTNNPVMFGNRLVLKYIVDVWGSGSQRYVSGVSHNGANKLDDLIRVLSVLDGKPEPDHRQGAWFKFNAVEWMRNGSGVQEVDLSYFKVRGFKNGNGHLTFSRLDLVEKMNLIIAKHYPGALAPMREAA